MNPAYLTENHLSELLRISVKTLQGWRVKSDEPPFLKVGRHIRYDKAKIIEFIEKRLRNSTSMKGY